MSDPHNGGCRNLLLNAMTTDDLELLTPHFHHVMLETSQVLAAANMPIEHVYFMEGGVASIVSAAPNSGSTEVGIFGREGLSGIAVLLGTDRSPHETFIQVDGGPAARIEVTPLLAAIDKSASLRTLLLRYIQTFIVQTAHSTVTNAQHQIEGRLARWLLMCHDRIDGNDIRLTHEFMSMMIAAQRTGVTLALHVLEGAGLIQSKRGLVRILNRERLEDVAGDAYGQPEAEYRRLIRPFGKSSG